MKKTLILILIILHVFNSCKKNKRLVFLGKNAYKHQVWKEMLIKDKIKVNDVIAAFNAYYSTNKLDQKTLYEFKKIKKIITKNVDQYGYYISEYDNYRKLISFREAKPNNLKNKAKININIPVNLSRETPNPNSKGQWTNIGPFGNPEVQWSATGNGAVQYIEMHPTDPATMYACTRNGGLWKTANYGKNWTPETDYFPTNNTSCLEISPANPSIFYLGAAEDKKIWYSSDGGNSWEDRSSGIDGEIYDIHSFPSDETKVITATTSGIYLSTNSGLTWEQKISGTYTDINLTDNWDLIIVANDDGGTPVFHFSKDQGESFIEQQITTTISDIHRFYMGLHKPTQGKPTIYAYGVKSGAGQPTLYTGLWKSNYTSNPANGETHFNFTEVKHPTYTYPNGTIPLQIADNADGYAELYDFYGSLNPTTSAQWISDFYISPNNPDWLLMFTVKFWGSKNGGVLWGWRPSYGGSNWADNRYVTTNISKDTIYWCNDGGIWAIKEDDLFPSEATVAASGLSERAYMDSKVIPKNGDICLTEGSEMDVSLMNKGVFITGGQDIGQVFVRNGRDSHVASSDVYRGRIKPNNDTRFITGGLGVKDKNGTSYHLYDHIETDHFNPNRIFGYHREEVPPKSQRYIYRFLRSPEGVDAWDVHGFKGEHVANEGGNGWTSSHEGWDDITPPEVTIPKPATFEQSRAKQSLGFYGDEVGRKLFMTENLIASTPVWTELTNAPKASRYRVASHQYNENIIVLATNIGVYISKDKGKTWIKRGNFPETNPSRVLIDKNTLEGIYVMTATTVYYIDEHLTEWVEFNKGLPLQQHRDMRIAYYADGDARLYVTKYGRGVWSSSLQSVLREKEDKPIIDFAIHGNSKKRIISGESITLIDLSSNATDLEWKLENGTEVITVTNETSPSIKLNTPGYYKVTLTATNSNAKSKSNSTDSKSKDQFILVDPMPDEANCNESSLFDPSLLIPWYFRLHVIALGADSYTAHTIGESYKELDKVFEINLGEEITLSIKDNHETSYVLYIKTWIDFNNDGDFDDAGEEIGDSNGKVNSFTDNFMVPNSAVTDKLLRMRVVTLNSSSPPSSCQTTGWVRQTLDSYVKVLPPKIIFSSSHTINSENSVALQATFSGAQNISGSGFVYSKFNGDLTVDNSSIAINPSTLTNNDNYTLSVNNLEYNTSYYYRPYIRDENGIHYGNKQTLELTPYTIPTSEGLVAQNFGENQWKLKGLIFPENQQLEEISLQYGIDNFNNEIPFDPLSYPTTSQFEIESGVIQTDVDKVYQFRVKIKSKGKTYYSNVVLFAGEQKHCIPTANDVWYRKISNVTFNGESNNSNGGTGYQDFTNLVYEVEAGKSYPISITDSNSPGQDLFYSVYIDFNDDGDFADYHEVLVKAEPKTDTFTGSITIPVSDISYNTDLRMRVVGSSFDIQSPCDIGTGEAEDYTIRIISKNIPRAEELPALNLGNNQWTLRGQIFPKTVNIDALELEYGSGNFNNVVTFDPSSYSSTSEYEIKKTINVIAGQNYQYRVKLEADGIKYYSNISSFTPDQIICTPTGNTLWYRQITNVTFNEESNSSSGGDVYQDFTNVIYKVEAGESYPISVTDSHSPGENLHYKVYIDFNNDGDFTGIGELATEGIPMTDTFTSTIAIPSEGVVYNTPLRMRVMGDTFSINNSCTVHTGQVEDYTIKIVSENIPRIEGLSALNLGNNEWKLRGKVFPKTVAIDVLELEYGNGNFDNVIAFDPTLYPSTSEYEIEEMINVVGGQNYQYRTKLVADGIVYYSDVLFFDPDQIICTPSGSTVWYRQISNVTFNEESNSSGGGGVYQDFTNTIFNVIAGETYPVSITDSNSPGQDLSYRVYIDFNNDGVFTDVIESTAQGTPNTDTFTSSISIPSEGIVYNTPLRMRIMADSYPINNSCSIVTGQIEDYSLTISPPNTWTGSSNTNWNDSSNWSDNSVPTNKSSIIIPPAQNSPITTSSVEIKKIIIKPGASLTVNGSILNNESLTILSDENSIGSLIVTGNISGNITYKHYIKDSSIWHLISPPISGQSISNFVNDPQNKINTSTTTGNYAVAYYNNSKDPGLRWTYHNSSPTFSNQETLGDFFLGKGYSINRISPGMCTFTGPMTTSDVTLNLTTLNGEHNWNAIGNPYTSYLPANASAENVNILSENINSLDPNFAALYIWNGNTYDIVNHVSNSYFISPNQSFLVKSKSKNETFTFSKSLQSHLKTTNNLPKALNQVKKIILTLSSSNKNYKKKTTEIRYLKNTTTGLDVGYDAGTYRNGIPNFSIDTHLVTQSQGLDFTLQCLPDYEYENLIVPLSIRAPKGLPIKIDATSFNLPENIDIYIEDKELKTLNKINKTSYQITLKKELKGIGRFYLHTKRSNVLNNEEVNSSTNKIKIFKSSKNVLRVMGLKQYGKVKVTLLNLLGVEVIENSFIGSSSNDIILPNIKTGIYIIHILTNKGKITKKIIL